MFGRVQLLWTKAREIVRVAKPETELEWLELALRLSSRELEKKVRELEGRDSGEFVTLTIAIPAELFSMWNDCHELTERLSGSSVERFQVLEPMMTEYLSTHVPAEHEDSPSPHETKRENQAAARPGGPLLPSESEGRERRRGASKLRMTWTSTISSSGATAARTTRRI